MEQPMNEPRVKKWIAALRSGDYPQTFKRLRDKQGFCCLGVACDLNDPGVWTPSILRSDGERVMLWDGEGAVLPQYMRTGTASTTTCTRN